MAVEACNGILVCVTGDLADIREGVVRVTQNAAPHVVYFCREVLPCVKEPVHVVGKVLLGMRNKGAIVDVAVKTFPVGENVLFRSANNDRPVWPVY